MSMQVINPGEHVDTTNQWDNRTKCAASPLRELNLAIGDLVKQGYKIWKCDFVGMQQAPLAPGQLEPVYAIIAIHRHHVDKMLVGMATEPKIKAPPKRKVKKNLDTPMELL